MSKPSAKQLDTLLPQTQCGECGYPGCLPYAEALAHGHATIDCCPPGGVETLNALGHALSIDTTPYLASVKAATRKPKLAVIQETDCIGCAKCLPACPVDAIIGSAKQMHTVLAHECTGCGLCVEPCPVDCIELADISSATYDKNLARKRFQAKKIRALSEAQAKEKQYQTKRKLSKNKEDTSKKQAYILAALKRAKGG